MSYSINYSDLSKVPLIVEDGTINATTDLSLLGRSVSGYGQHIAQNFLYLLENFASPTEPDSPTAGQLWYDSDNDLLKYYTKDGNWKNANSNTVNIESPQDITNYNAAEGDIWYDTTNDYLYIYADNEWKNILQFDENNRVMINNRYDNTGVVHKTMEFVLNAKIVYIISTDDTTWTPSSYGGNAERMPDGRLLINDYPTISKGLNLNFDRSYNIHNFYVTQLGEVAIDVGLGDVYIEQNSFDSGGPGFTLRPSSDPQSQFSFFSARSTNNDAKFWVGIENTTVGTNGFAAGFTGDTGEEHDITKYNIVLGSNGSISAESIDTVGNITSGGSVSAESASGNWVAVETDIDDGTSNEKIVTPAMLDYALLSSETFNANTKIVATTREAKTGGSYPVLEHVVSGEIIKITYEYDTLHQFEIADSELDYQGRQLNTYFSGFLRIGDNYPNAPQFILIDPTTQQELDNALGQVSKTLPTGDDGTSVPLYASTRNANIDFYDPANPDEHIVYFGRPPVVNTISRGTTFQYNSIKNTYDVTDQESVQEVNTWKTVATLNAFGFNREWSPLFVIKANILFNFISTNLFGVRIVRSAIPNVSAEEVLTSVTYDLPNIAQYDSRNVSLNKLDIIGTELFFDPTYSSSGNGTPIEYRLETQLPTGTTGNQLNVIIASIEATLHYVMP